MPLPGCMMPDGAQPCEAYTAMRNLVEQMVEAIVTGNIDSPELSGESDTPPHKWHEEWLHSAQRTLQES